MAVCEIRLTSQHALQKMTSFMAILPEGRQGPFPVLYLLHGLSDDHTAWTRRTSIERYLHDVPLIVIMPNGERGWYTDAVNNPNAAFETFITRDLVGFVDGMLNTIAERRGRAIAGLSMGGYGAFKLALKHPDLFCAAVSFSGALDMQARMDNMPERSAEYTITFGGRIAGTQEDVFTLLRQADPDTRPALWMSCGTDDFLIDDNRRAHKLMESLNIPHFYREDPGFAHGWNYWDLMIQEALTFLKEQLGIEVQA